MNQDTKTLNKRINKYYVYRVIYAITYLAFIIPFLLQKEINSSSVYFIASMSIVLSIWMINKVFIIRYLYKDKDSLPKTTANLSPKKWKISWKDAFITSIVELIIGLFVILPLMIMFDINQNNIFAGVIAIIMTLVSVLTVFPTHYLLSVTKELKSKRDLQIQQ